MGKDVKWTQTYNSSAENAFAVLSDREFLTALAHDTGSLEASVEVTSGTDDSVTITNSRTFPAEVPSYAKSFVGDTISVTEQQNWGAPTADGARTGTFEVTFGSAPVAFHGTLALDGNNPCTVTTEGTIKASLPLVGGKIEGLVSDQIGAYMNEMESHASKRLS